MLLVVKSPPVQDVAPCKWGKVLSNKKALDDLTLSASPANRSAEWQTDLCDGYGREIVAGLTRTEARFSSERCARSDVRLLQTATLLRFGPQRLAVCW